MGFRFTRMEGNRKVLMEKPDVSLEWNTSIKYANFANQEKISSTWMSPTYIHPTLNLGVVIRK